MKTEKNDIFNREQYYDKDEKIPLNDLVDRTSDEILRNKSASANEILVLGDRFVNEKEKKKERFEKSKQKQIKYILKYTDSYFYDELNSLTYHDVKVIYLEIKHEHKNKLKKIFDFLFQFE